MHLKRLHLLLIRSFLGPFFLIFIVVLFLLLMQFLWRYIDDLVGKGLGFQTIAELMFYTSASLVPMALPLSILMSSLMTFGNLGENYELSALKSAGVSLQRIMKPLIILNIFISLSAFVFANNILPIANLKMRSLLYDIRKQRREVLIRPGEFYNDINKYSIRVGSNNEEGDIMYDILIYDHSQRNGNRKVTRADSGYMKMTEDSRYLFVTLYNGESYSELEEERPRSRIRRYPHEYDKFKEQNLVIELTGFGLERTDESLFRSNYQMMNLKQLNYFKDSLNDALIDRQNTFSENIISQSYKESPYFFHNNRPRKGELIREKQEKQEKQLIPKTDTLNMSEIYERLTLDEKQRVITSTLSSIKNGGTYISSVKDGIELHKKKLNKYKLEWNRKFTIAYACFIFMFIGAPLGAIIRKGGIGMPVVISTVLFIFYYIITLTSEKLVAEGTIDSNFGPWMASIVLTSVGLFLTYKATTDSVIMNIDTYFGLITKTFKKIFPKKAIK